METLSATRTELLARRHRIEFARHGRSILQDKREQLLAEFRKLADQALASGSALETAATRARDALAAAEVAHGAEAIRAMAQTRKGTIRLRAVPRSVMGVAFPEITHERLVRARTERGYSLAGSSAHVDRVAQRFESTLELVLDAATEELRLRRIADEIRATTRRINAVEQFLIPQLDHECRTIEAVLDERERQEQFRLRRIRRRK